MNTEHFIEKLSQAEELISQEHYVDALNILYKLKEIELKGDFDNSLTHKLYQLISNSESLLNQKRIINGLSVLAEKHQEIDFDSIKHHFEHNLDYHFESGILRREIELLILRDKIPYKIQANKLVFS
jgi:hypothetical protein